MVIKNWFKIYNSQICFILSTFFIFIAGGYVEAWALMKVFIYFTIGVFFFGMGIAFMNVKNRRN
jgi:hypothetical protein